LVNKFDEALQYLDKAIAKQPQDSIAYQLKGEVLLKSNKPNESQLCFAKANEMDGDYNERLNTRKHKFVRDLLSQHLSDVKV